MKRLKSGLITTLGFFVRPSRMDMTVHLEKAAGKLTQLNASTETEFLSLGKRLQDYYLQTKEISDDSSSVAVIMSGNEITALIDGLKEIFNNVKQLDIKSNQGVEILTSILSKAQAIRSQLDYFSKVVRNLNILCISIKIETARITGSSEEFSALAENIKKLADNIESKSKHLINQSQSLSLLLQNNLILINNFEARQQVQSGLIIDRTTKNLGVLSERHEFSALAVKKLSEKWNSISQSIGEVVASIQFHDITHQQIEHAIGALTRLTSKLKNPNSTANQSGIINRVLQKLAIGRKKNLSLHPKKAASNTAIVCRLQMAQIKNSGDELFSAVTRIVNSLKNISKLIEEISEEAGNMTGNKEQSKESFLTETEKDLSGLTESLADYAQLNKQIESTIHQVANTIAEMSSFVIEIEKIGFDMKIVALNTIVHAAHTGAEGLSLSILAEAIHNLSVETSANIKLIAENLKSFIVTSDQLTQNSQIEVNDKWKDKDYILRLIEPIRQSNQKILTFLFRIDHSGKDFQNEIEETIKKINVHKRMAHEIKYVNSGLSSLVDYTRRFIPETLQSEQNKELKELTQIYTMKKERKIHESVTFSPALSEAGTGMLKNLAAAGKKTAPGGAETNFGHNVELF